MGALGCLIDGSGGGGVQANSQRVLIVASVPDMGTKEIVTAQGISGMVNVVVADQAFSG